MWSHRWTGIFIINVGKTYEKLELAARVIAAIENPQDIIVQSARPYGQRAVLKFAQYTGCQAIAGRHTPGTFTNQLQNTFSEPRLLILTDPRTDHQVRVFWMALLGADHSVEGNSWGALSGGGQWCSSFFLMELVGERLLVLLENGQGMAKDFVEIKVCRLYEFLKRVVCVVFDWKANHGGCSGKHSRHRIL